MAAADVAAAVVTCAAAVVADADADADADDDDDDDEVGPPACLAKWRRAAAKLDEPGLAEEPLPLPLPLLLLLEVLEPL